MQKEKQQEYQIASLSSKALSELNQIQQMLSQNANKEIVLVAYQKKEEHQA